jgi:hypothetical protein
VHRACIQGGALDPESLDRQTGPLEAAGNACRDLVIRQDDDLNAGIKQSGNYVTLEEIDDGSAVIGRYENALGHELAYPE